MNPTAAFANDEPVGGLVAYELNEFEQRAARSSLRTRGRRSDVAEGVLTTDLPVNTQFLTPHFWLNNGTTAAAVELSVVNLYAEPASLLGSRGSIL